VGGIAGIVHFQGDPPARELGKQLSSAVSQRGPDDKALVFDPPAVLVQRVYSTDPSPHRPPWETDRFVFLLDGTGDRDRLLAEWIDTGMEALSSLNGGFSLAIWDRLERVLWLARDPTGTRPLFFSHRTPRIAFSSTLPSLLALPWVSRDIATEHLAEYLSFRYVHAPRTLVRDVSQVPPGHIARIDRSGVRIDRWWHPKWSSPDESVASADTLADRIDTALRHAVERHTRTIVPTGILLSGGLDSAAILHHARATTGQTPPTFTVALAGDPADESAFAARVASTYGAEHHRIEVDNMALMEVVPSATLHMGQPLPSPAALVQYRLFEALGPSIRILLSGAGGDEILGGRSMPDIAQRLRQARTLSRLPGPARRLGRRAARSAGLADLASTATHFGLERKIGGSRVFSAEERVRLLRDPAMARPGIRTAILEPFYQEVHSDPLNEILHVWQRGWLTEDVLARADRMASAHGLHLRFPMLDTEMLRAAAAIPGPEKVRRKGAGYIPKAPLRQAMHGRISARLLNRPKRGVPKPMDRWLRGPGAMFLQARVEQLCADSSDLFIPETLRGIVRSHLDGDGDHAMQLWALLMFDAWRSKLS